MEQDEMLMNGMDKLRTQQIAQNATKSIEAKQGSRRQTQFRVPGLSFPTNQEVGARTRLSQRCN